MLPDVARLDERISLQRICRLRDFLVTSYIRQANNLYTTSEEGTHFLELMGIITRKYQLFHTFVSLRRASYEGLIPPRMRLTGRSKIKENTHTRHIAMNIEQLHDYCLSLPHVHEGMPFGEGYIVYKVVDRIFAILTPDGVAPRLSLKCDPDRAEELRASYTAIIPGYHLNKRYWNTLLLEEHLPSSLLRSLIRHSWNEASAKLTKSVRTQLGITPLPIED